MLQPFRHIGQTTRGKPRRLQQLERVAHLHLIAARGIFGHDLKPALGVPHLAHGGGVVGVQLGPEFAEKFKIFRLVL